MTGDGIMALFGASIALEDAPQRAILSALAIHREMAKLSDELKHKKEGVPSIKMRIGNFKSAQDNAENNLDIAQKNSMRLDEGQAWNILGRVLGKKKPAEFEKAEEYIRGGIDQLEELECKPVLSQGYLYLGDLYNDMGRKDDAVKILKIAEDMLKEMGNIYYLDKTQKLLERI